MGLNHIKFSILLISTILLQFTAFAAGQPTNHFILPSNGQEIGAFHMVVIGDSVAWGNGLKEEDKYYYLVADWLQKTLNRPVDVTVYAHSGATISGESGKAIDPNLNSGYPTLEDQANSIQNADDVDLILVSGGINDVNSMNIINVNEPVDEIQKSSEAIEVPMENLLTNLLDNDKKAKIIVTSYYPIVSEDINEGFITSIISLIAQLQGSVGEHEIILLNKINQKSRLVENSYTFNGAILTSLTNAVKDADNGANRISFSMVNFLSNRCYGTSESWLWSLVSLTPPKTDDDQFEYRSSLTSDLIDKINAMGHPNKDGAKEYARAIEATIKSKGLVWLQNGGVESSSKTEETTRILPGSFPVTPGKWPKTFGGSGEDEGSSVQQTTDGGYILTGGTTSFGAGNWDLWLIKTDAGGNKLWDKTFGGSGYDYGNSIQQTMDGGYIITGYIDPDGSGRRDMWLLKTDAGGNKLWDKIFEDGEGLSVQQTTDGGYIICGPGKGGPDNESLQLVKTDASGNKLWNRTFERFGNYTSSSRPRGSVQQTSDNGYIIARDIGAAHGVLNAWLIRTDVNGNKLWDRVFGGSNVSDISGIYPGNSLQTNDGGFIIAGTICNDSGWGAWMIKTDTNGNKIWERAFFEGQGSGDSSAQKTSDGGYIIAGGYGPLLIKTDANGNEIWIKGLGNSNHGESESVRQTSDGGYIVTGSTDVDNSDKKDVLLIKTDANGDV